VFRAIRLVVPPSCGDGGGLPVGFVATIEVCHEGWRPSVRGARRPHGYLV